MAKRAPKKPSSRAGTRQAQVRMPDELADRLDAYVAALNARRRYPKLTRTGVILGVVDWVIRTGQDWEERPGAVAPPLN